MAVGGHVAVDIYPRLWRNVLWSKYWLRPLTRRMQAVVLMRMVQRGVPLLLPVSRLLGAVPGIGLRLKYLLPVANYDGVYSLSEGQLMECAILDTFDMLAPEHDHPQSAQTLARWCRDAGLLDVEIFRRGHLIARGVVC